MRRDRRSVEDSGSGAKEVGVGSSAEETTATRIKSLLDLHFRFYICGFSAFENDTSEIQARLCESFFGVDDKVIGGGGAGFQGWFVLRAADDPCGSLADDFVLVAEEEQRGARAFDVFCEGIPERNFHDGFLPGRLRLVNFDREGSHGGKRSTRERHQKDQKQ